MANIGWQVSFRVKDADDEIFSIPLYGFSVDTRTLANMASAMSNIGSLIDAVLDGKVISCGLCLDIPLLGTIKANPVSGSEIERTGLIPFPYATTPQKVWSLDLPAFAYSKFLSGTNQINVADADVAALITALTVGGTEVYTNPDKTLSLQAATTGYKTFRKHRRQTKRT